jgi:hypothetical protein
MLKGLADNSNDKSLASSLRRKRHSFFLGLISGLPRPVTILDVGGTESYWNIMGMTSPGDFKITLLNIRDAQSSSLYVGHVVGDARVMDFEDKCFDVVFSNSVIEHVGGREDQKRMADEVMRVGRRYFIQTPNRFFPMEPHFLFPLFQFLPLALRIQLLRNFGLGWIPKTPNALAAKKIVESIRLLDKKELVGLFPGAGVYEERVAGLVKSFVVYDGWEAAGQVSPVFRPAGGG